ncbi:AfsA-related hotdog domain-containing protein [Kitasatospora kifunensis]|uniref:A-factor biosynthesis hotdog domain-containing protein n=1 Tax=Kitasatospora kifunensis TaxID=58351 RepID=A0A7W7VVP4_KITKI|nr:AfsA-related hotdog domain-containing protein [Kitasatospora kifunensis]MBB4924601.1 hypothetical protein [Kitasatospora kifunensis]
MTTLDVRTDPTADLSTRRTIDRHLVHRAAIAEVFLTDFRTIDSTTFEAAAQLPPAHSYYGDHTGRPELHDPLAVFESVRQMLLCAMHLQHGASHDTKSITAECRMEITDPLPLLADGGVPELTLLGKVALEKLYDGVTARVVHDVEVLVGGRSVGTVSVDTALRPNDIYQGLRMSHRTTPPPYSDTLPTGGPAAPVRPHLVGREHAENVVLRDVRDTEDTVVARLHVPVAHRSMFDHPQDHVPGPVMMEAARQAAVFLLGERFGQAPAKLFLQQITATYLRFAELDSDLLVQACLVPDDDAAAADGGKLIAVSLLQSNQTVARIQVRLGLTVGWPQDTLGAHDAL